MYVAVRQPFHNLAVLTYSKSAACHKHGKFVFKPQLLTHLAFFRSLQEFFRHGKTAGYHLLRRKAFVGKLRKCVRRRGKNVVATNCRFPQGVGQNVRKQRKRFFVGNFPLPFPQVAQNCAVGVYRHKKIKVHQAYTFKHVVGNFFHFLLRYSAVTFVAVAKFQRFPKIVVGFGKKSACPQVPQFVELVFPAVIAEYVHNFALYVHFGELRRQHLCNTVVPFARCHCENNCFHICF